MSLGIIASHYVASGGGGGGYSSEVLADSPLLYWRLGDASGSSTAADSSGNSRTGTPVGSPVFGTAGLVTGDADTCADFSFGARVEIADAAWMGTGAFALDALIHADALGSSHVIAARHQNSAAKWMLRVDAGTLKFWINSNGSSGWQQGASFAGLSTGTKYHVGASWDGTTAQVYVNGTAGTSGTPTMWSGTAGLSIGANYADIGNERWDGRIDEFAYYSSLSAARFAAHAAAA